MDSLLTSGILGSLSNSNLILLADRIVQTTDLSLTTSSWKSINLGIATYRICIVYANSITGGVNQSVLTFVQPPILVPNINVCTVELIYANTNTVNPPSIDCIFNTSSSGILQCKSTVNSTYPTRCNFTLFLFE